jgi:hydrogenase maturation protein HypF
VVEKPDRGIQDNRQMSRRIRCYFKGIVQGVGFRPFIFRTAVQYGLTGFVQNTIDGVTAEVQGSGSALEDFLLHITNNAPPLSEITGPACSEIPTFDESDFKILESRSHGDLDAYSPPDSATCDDCLRELFDPKDRRYRYPFINCTNCGPRLTIVKDLPYDRDKTAMACFPFCPDCKNEYENPANSRFHAEPNACPVCGPRVRLLDASGKECLSHDPVVMAIDSLKQGLIIAIKGLGGFHLAVDAGNDAAVQRLRKRKCREEKPFAIMVRDLNRAHEIVETATQEERLLASPQRPIVLLSKKNTGVLSELVAPHMNRLGVMLAYTPLHHLLLEHNFTALVMTSANRTDEPICTGNREAVQRLQGIADFFLVHNRDILVRCDDSIAMVASGKPRLMRRARGFAPRPVMLARKHPAVLALGPHLKSTICIIKDKQAFLSPHIGDMETPQARDFFHENISLMKKITQCSPAIIACDMHPGYYSTTMADDMQDVRIVKVQHHHAHIASCMAENRIYGKLIGLAMDGTGYGTDGTIWGGEFLIADEKDFIRAGHIQQFRLPGSEAAIHDSWRIGASLLRESFGDEWPGIAARLSLAPNDWQYELLEKMIGSQINCPITSSLGRLFDGVAALLGIRSTVNFEGQAAMELEAVVDSMFDTAYPFTIDYNENILCLNYIPAIKELVSQRLKGTSPTVLAASFHTTLIRSFIEMAERIRSTERLNRVVLSGGCFQNRLLLEGCITGLIKTGFEVYSHHLVPTNDGGISLGQAYSVAARL